MTPFSPQALDRGLTAVLVALVRHLGIDSAWNPNGGAAVVTTTSAELDTLIDELAARARDITGISQVGDELAAALRGRLDQWAMVQEQKRLAGTPLAYADDRSAASSAVGLLRAPDLATWDLFTCPHSLRETEPNIQLLLDLVDDTAVKQTRPFPPAPAAAPKAATYAVAPVPAEDADIDVEQLESEVSS
ncbi:MAG TPA: hypothetical protein VF178_13420 [Gemmatimonadaceae bacterium]